MRQAEMIRGWKPWERTCGPSTAEGKAISSRNAFKGGRRQELRTLAKIVNAMLRDQRECLLTAV